MKYVQKNNGDVVEMVENFSTILTTSPLVGTKIIYKFDNQYQEIHNPF